MFGVFSLLIGAPESHFEQVHQRGGGGGGGDWHYWI